MGMLNGLFHAESSETPWNTYVNVAINQPTWQSGTYGQYGSNLAVDGNKYTDIFAGSCSHTSGGTPPWWAVDLGSLTYVYGVNLTNRNGAGCKFLVRSISSIKYVY
jgi:hypothetical protein